MLLSQVPSANSCVAIAQDPPQLGCPGDHVFPALPNPVSLANILNQSPVRTPLAVASPEIPAVFERLDDPSRDLAALLVFLGRADIPTSMLLRAAKPKEHFNQAGEVELASALQLNPWFANSQSLNSVLELLESSSLIHICKESQSIRVMPALRSYVESTVGSDRGAIEYKASLLVFNSFPIHPNLETDRKELFATFAGSQVPHIQHVVGYFDTPDFVGRFSLQQRKLIIPVCLSSSGFGSLDWKCRVLDTAEKIIKTCEAHSLSSARLQLRRIVLRRLYYSEEPKEFPMHLGSNIFKGEMTLVRVQQRLYRDELFQSWQELESWQPVDSMRAGAEEELILQKKLLLQTRVCRFAGEFSTAKNFLCTLKTLGLCRGIAPYYFTEFVSVFCEAGDVEAAINTLPSTGNFWGEGWIAGTVGRRASHAAAGTHLMTGLWKLKSHGLDHALGPLREAKAIYQALSKVYLEVPNIGLNSSIRHFSISAGLAMIAHMEWRFTNTVTGQEALDFWQTAMKLGKASGKILGGSPFPEMIILYSMCDVASRLGLEDWTTHMMDEAGSLYQKTGRQFQYLALGTIWFDLVQEWNAENGLSGMSELCFEDYMAEQRARGFPYTSSARLCK
ncbi:hypothetical protein DL98DRAFT_521481 [Cadophora sp. DSE1049]|nr:hypothetical protein DL98DRAFT_521481 [Cadophora sp. DSE1049]